MNSWLNALDTPASDMNYEFTETDDSAVALNTQAAASTELKSPDVSPMTSQKVGAPVGRLYSLRDASAVHTVSAVHTASVMHTTCDKPFTDAQCLTYSNFIAVEYEFTVGKKTFVSTMKPASIRRLNQIMEQNTEWFATIRNSRTDYSVLEFCTSVSTMYMTAVFAIMDAGHFYDEIQDQLVKLFSYAELIKLDISHPKIMQMIDSLQNLIQNRTSLFKTEETQIIAANLHTAHLFTERKKNHNSLVGFKDLDVLQRLDQIKAVVNLDE